MVLKSVWSRITRHSLELRCSSIASRTSHFSKEVVIHIWLRPIRDTESWKGRMQMLSGLMCPSTKINKWLWQHWRLGHISMSQVGNHNQVHCYNIKHSRWRSAPCWNQWETICTHWPRLYILDAFICLVDHTKRTTYVSAFLNLENDLSQKSEQIQPQHMCNDANCESSEYESKQQQVCTQKQISHGHLIETYTRLTS